MKFNFPLDKFELHVEDTLLIEAENLLTLNDLPQLKEVEKNLFLVHFTEGGSKTEKIETEVQLVGGKVKTAACECDTFKLNGMCAHIAASLLQLNEQKKAKEAAKKEIKVQQAIEASTNTRLTVPNILKNIDDAQLIDFIADYARTDKQFALALKTRFAGDLAASGDIAEHYKTLIDNTLKNAKNQKGKFTPKGWLQVFTLLDELRQKAESRFRNGELPASFALIAIVLPLIHKFMRPSDAPKIKLEKRQVQLVEILRGFNELPISPELSNEMWDFLSHEWQQSVRHPFSERLFDWLFKQAKSAERTEKLLALVDHQLHVNRSFLEAKDRLLTQKIQILQKAGRIDEACQLILSASEQPDVLYFAIENAFANRDFTLAKSLCKNGLTIFGNSPNALDQIESLLLDIAEAEYDRVDILDYAEKRFYKSLDLKYFEKIKAIGLSTKKRDEIIKNLENQPLRLERRNALAAIYTSEKQFDKLTALILQVQSLDLLRRFGVDLWRQDTEGAIHLHKKVIYEYLMSHLGRPPAQRIRQVLEAHLQRGGLELTTKLRQDLIGDFTERYSLKEELNDMMEEFEKKKALGLVF
ncbi:MAG: SWIM zinc finger family protein [Saprospiraceae bacterium]|nr:SWIM zinc finger family protein [Saprospiraceae bacterium]